MSELRLRHQAGAPITVDVETVLVSLALLAIAAAIIGLLDRTHRRAFASMPRAPVGADREAGADLTRIRREIEARRQDETSTPTDATVPPNEDALIDAAGAGDDEAVLARRGPRGRAVNREKV